MPSIVCLPRAWDRHLKYSESRICCEPQPVAVCEYVGICDKYKDKKWQQLTQHRQIGDHYVNSRHPRKHLQLPRGPEWKRSLHVLP